MFAIAVTDGDWFRYLRWKKIADNVNFWTPHPWNVRGISDGQRWYFKLRQGGDIVCGYGVFVRYEEMTLEEAWHLYQQGNGCASIDDFRVKIQEIIKDYIKVDKHRIGCVILNKCVYCPDKMFLHLDQYGISFPRQVMKYSLFDQSDPLDIKC